MTEEQFAALDDFIQAKIEAADRASGIHEAVREMDCRRDVREAFGLPIHAPAAKTV